MDNNLIKAPEQTNEEVALKMTGFETAFKNGELDHLFPPKSFKEKYQNKLQRLSTEILNDSACSTVADGQQQYIIMGVYYLIEVDRMGDLMRILVENFGEDLQYM